MICQELQLSDLVTISKLDFSCLWSTEKILGLGSGFLMYELNTGANAGTDGRCFSHSRTEVIR